MSQRPFSLPRTWAVGIAAAVAAPALLMATPANAVVGAEVSDDSYAFTAQIIIGDHDRGCSGALVDPSWVITAGSCFVDDPASGAVPAAGKPAKTAKVIVGRPDLTTTAGTATEITELVPYQGRDLVMAHLAEPATGVTPATVSTTPPVAGETLTSVGFGRSKTEWAPLKQHTGVFTADTVEDTEIAITGQNGDAICPGDAGGPLLREKDGAIELVAVNSRSWQGGCWGVDAEETRTGAVDTRVDDLSAWIQQVRGLPQQAQVTAGDFNGDGKADVAALYDEGQDAAGRGVVSLWVFDSDGTALRAPRVVWNSNTSWRWSSSTLTSGDFNGDGKTDIAVLYNYGRTTDGRNHTGLWVFTSTGNTFQAPAKVWDSGDDSWNWDASKVTSGDYNGDGRTDVAVLYNYGQAADGRNQTGLWFVGGADGLGAPKKVWTNDTSWNWNASKPTSGDYNGDGKADVGVLYNYGQDSVGRNHTGLWTMAGTDAGVAAPKKIWDSSTSWNWNVSQPVSGDFNGDGKCDLAVFYDYGHSADGRRHHGLWTFISTGDGMNNPHLDWDNALQ